MDFTGFCVVIADTVDKDSGAYHWGELAGKGFVGVLIFVVLWQVLGGGRGKKKKEQDIYLPGSTRFKPEKKVSEASARVTGACMLAAAIVLMFVAEWVARSHPGIFTAPAGDDNALRALWLLRTGAALMPALAGVGLARIAAGKSQMLNKMFGIPLGIAGLLLGVAFAAGMSPSLQNGVHDSIAGWMDSLLGHAGAAPKPGVSRAELDAALADARATAASIAQRQQTVNKSDKAAMDALQKDITAYNARQAVVKKMYDDYMAAQNANADFKKKVAGEWRMDEDLSGQNLKVHTSLSLMSDGHFEAMVDNEIVTGKPTPPPDPLSGHIDPNKVTGTWSLEGHTLTFNCDPIPIPTDLWNKPQVTMTVTDVDDKSLTLKTEKGKKVWQRK